MTLHVRRATRADAQLLFDWANDPSVREQAFDPRAIAWSDHCDWLARKLDDARSAIWIAERDGVAIGQLRVDLDSGEECLGEIDFSVAREFRGRGFGTTLLERGCAAAFAHFVQLETLQGTVKAQNTGSAKSFLNAGFSQTAGLVTVRGCPCLRYRRSRQATLDASS